MSEEYCTAVTVIEELHASNVFVPLRRSCEKERDDFGGYKIATSLSHRENESM